MVSTYQQYAALLSAFSARGSTALVDYLQGLVIGKWTKVQDGWAVVSTSANGHSTTLKLDLSDLSPTSVVELFVRLHRLALKSRAQLEGTPTDQQILDEMLLRLEPCKGYENDFSLMRTGEVPA